MAKLYVKFFLLLILLLASPIIYAASPSASLISPVGDWLTIDDATNKPRSIVQIWQAPDGQLKGNIIKVYYRPGEKPTDVCDKCTDPAHQNKLIMGMTILWGMQQESANEWNSGQILDPNNGKIYRCLITIAPNGQQLNVRGYIGIPLLGRSQTWIRVDTK